MKYARGFTLIEVLIGLGILGIVSGAIYSAYGSVLQIIQASQYNSSALSIIESQVETVRNMRYEDVGTAGGVPTGKIPQVQTVTVGTIPFTLHTYVRNIDDPFDGTLGGAPNDTSPADYKLVEFQVTCDTCTRYNIISLSTYVAPKNLESTSHNGNLFIKVFDASGQPVVGATVHVTNTKVVPNIDLTDITNSAGMLQLVGTATASAGYHLVATKNGYSSDQTYPPGNPANPLKPDATVANQQLTISSLAIDHTSTLAVRARDQFCQAVPGMDFLLTGTKLIGTNPDTPKYSVGQITDTTGILNLTTLEWDTYKIKPTDSTFDIAGKDASLSFAVDPGASQNTTWMIASRSGSALLVTVADSSGQLLNDATVQLTKAGFSASTLTAHSTFGQTDWSAGRYDSKSSLLNTDGTAGMLTLMQVGGKYATSSEEWLISKTYDMGSTSATFTDLAFNPVSQPAQTTLRIQVAANNDNTTWNWIDPSQISSLSTNRYFRYKAFLGTTNSAVTPSLNDLAIGFQSGCLMSGQSYINGLSAGAYTLTVSKTGYQSYSGPVNISTNWQEAHITLSP